jgi:uncharacterized NAD-dependent epimerase/dehydratase family protein
MRRLLILAEGYSADPHHGKTMRGVVDYGQDTVVAVIDSERAGGSHKGIPIVADVAAAMPLGPDTILVGVAPTGGKLPPAWRGQLQSAIRQGLDVESGLHDFVTADPELVELAAGFGVELRDLRRPPADLDVATGANLELPTTTVLTVGSDCAIGKMTVSLELDRELRGRGVRSVFVPTGQTGIAIAGWGIAVDAVVADFIAGAAERLVVEGYRRGGEDVLLVEGQGSIIHPGYSGVTYGLIHGSAPHLFVLCHLAGDTHIEGYPRHPILPLAELVALHERIALPARPARVACIALNTRKLDEAAARAAIAAAEAETGLVADDVVRFGPARLVDALQAQLPPAGPTRGRPLD